MIRMVKLFTPAKIKINFIRFYSSKPPWNAIFFGSDQFSLYSLKLLYTYHLKSNLFNKFEVVTNITKNANVIQKFADEHNIPIHKWPNVPLQTTYDVGVVVSFGYLIPESIIAKFSYGILNVHASLLPRWRGAAPIIYALANGDKETGVTVMRISPHKFDVGDILLQEKFPIDEHIEMPELHKCLGELGAKSLLNTLLDLPNYIKNSKPQSTHNVTYAPKVKPDFGVVKWDTMTSVDVYNLHRALKGFLFPISTWDGAQTKLSGVKVCHLKCDKNDIQPGYVIYDKITKNLIILCADNTYVSVERVGIAGKKIMNATDFNNGFLCKKPVDLRYFK